MTDLLRRTALLAVLLFATAASGQPAPDFTALVKKAGPAVVNVITTAKAGGARAQGQPQLPPEFEEFFRRFSPQAPQPGPRQGVGSGFIISADGLVLTNAHVVAGADQVTVRLADAKREFTAKVLGADERTDVALLKVDAQGLPTLQLGNSQDVVPGQWVAAIGSPFGFANTITSGIVSAVGRSLPGEAYVPYLQTDVAVNPGNSGGPLLTLDGKVVGINSMIYSGTGGYMGVSFAIPIEIALDVSKQLQASGKVTRGRIGVSVQPLTRDLAKAFDMQEPAGALVSQVERDSPAAAAGLKPGDVVTRFKGEPVTDMNDLPRLVASAKPGETVSITVMRQGKPHELKITPEELAGDPQLAQAGATASQSGGRLGISVSELPPAQRKNLDVDYGLVVQEVEKPGVPLRPGDVILAVNNDRFGSVQEFRKLVDAAKGESVALLVRRGEGTIYVPVPLA